MSFDIVKMVTEGNKEPETQKTESDDGKAATASRTNQDFNYSHL